MQRFQAFFVARCLCHRPPWLRPCEVNGVQRLQDFGAHVLLSNLQITWKLATGVKESATKRSLQNPSKIRSLIVPLGSCHFPAWKSESVFCLSWKFYPKILVIQSQEWLLPWELTWNLKITQLKRRLIWNLNLKTFIFASIFVVFPAEITTLFCHQRSRPRRQAWNHLWWFVTNYWKKESGAAASRKIQTQKNMDDNVIMSVHLILRVYMMYLYYYYMSNDCV